MVDRHPCGSFHWTVLGWAFALVLLEISKNHVILHTLPIPTHIMAYLSSLSWLPQFTTVRRTTEASGSDFWCSLTGNGIYICTLSQAWGISLGFVFLLWALGIWHHTYLAAAVLGPYRNHRNTLLFQIQKCSTLFRSTSIGSVLYVFGVEPEKGLSVVIPDLMLVVGSSPGCFSLNSELSEFRV